MRKSSMKKQSSTKNKAAPATAAANASKTSTASTKAAKAAKASTPSPAQTATQIAADLEAFLRRLRKPRIAKVAAEIAAYAKSAGPGFAKAAEEVGVLQRAAKICDLDLVRALLDAGVDPNTDSHERPGDDRALAAIFDEWEIDDKKALVLVTTLLARGANPDHLNHDGPRVINHNIRRTTALDAAAKRRAMTCISELARVSSAATRSHALNTLLHENYHLVDDGGERAAMIDRIAELADLDVADHDGLYPLHVAALHGDEALFRRLFARAAVKEPRLARQVSTTLHLGVSPHGGSYPTLMYPAGASPLAVARIVKARLAQTVAEYARPDVDAGKRARYVPHIERVVGGCAAIIAFLESEGQVDDAKAAPLAGPLETVRAACSELAGSLGIKSFDERAALIDSTRTGAFGYFLECARLIRDELDEAGRAKLEQHLIGRFITGSVHRSMFLRDEEDELAADFGPDPNAFCVWPENYPPEFRELLEHAAHYGVNGDAVLCLEPRGDDTTKLWEISPTQGIDHGPVDQWVRQSVAALLES